MWACLIIRFSWNLISIEELKTFQTSQHHKLSIILNPLFIILCHGITGDTIHNEPISTHWPLHDVIKWKHFPRYWPFVWGIHRSPVNSPHKGQWRGALMFPLICTWRNRWVNNRESGVLRCHRAYYEVTVMLGDSSGIFRLLWHICIREKALILLWVPHIWITNPSIFLIV